MHYACGSFNGSVTLFDFRYDKPLLSIQHQYKEPINSIVFHNKSKNILSSSKKILKINNVETGKIFTNIEPKEEINSFELVKDSGLILVANEAVRIGMYFIPALDSAPKWCHYIENVTEELEEELVNKVYDEFKFLSYEDLEKLNATNLIGTKMIKQYMHGYLMHYKLYQKLENINDPFAYEKYHKDMVNKKLEEKRKNRIFLQVKQKKKVNEEFANELEKKKLKKNIDYQKEIIDSDRFKVMFENDKFAIDPNSEEYTRNNSQNKKNLIGNYKANDEIGAEREMENDEDEYYSKKVPKIKKNKRNIITKRKKI